MKIKETFTKIGYISTSIKDDIDVKGISFDSRKIHDKDVFFDLKPGEIGERYSMDAIKNGASCVVSEIPYVGLPVIVVPNCRRSLSLFCMEFYDHPEKKMKLIGVTGTNGKTSVTHMIAGLYRSFGKKVAIIGTLGADIDGEHIDFGMTTPDTPVFFDLLNRACKRGVEYVVTEVSAHAVYFDKLYCVPFYIGVFTNLSQDHLDFFVDLDAYARVKGSWIKSENVEKVTINCSDRYGRSLLSSRPGSIFPYGEKIDIPDDASLFGEKGLFLTRSNNKFYSSFTIEWNGEEYLVESPYVGKFNAENLLAALSVLLCDGYSLPDLLLSVKSLPKIPGRLQVIKSGPYTVVVDYAHTPDGLKNVLGATKEVTDNRLLCLFGCGGNRDKGKRPLMGETAEKFADVTILTSDNPRWEDPIAIIKDVLSGMRKVVTVIPDRQEAIRYAINLMKPGDVLVVAGKGAEEYMEIKGEKHPYSDISFLKEILK